MALQVAVMFWNVENCFDSFDDPIKNDDEFLPKALRHWTWNRLETKLQGIAKTIIAASDAYEMPIAAVGFAEVENKLVMNRLTTKTLLTRAGDWAYVHRESPDERGIDVALAYRKDLIRVLKVDSIRTEGLKTRDILYVKSLALKTDDTLHILVCHLPSKLGGKKKSDGRRQLVYQRLESCIDSISNASARVNANPEPNIVLMGDFNDEAPAVPSLNHLNPEMQSNIGGSLKYRGKWETIDHFFVSPPLASQSRASIFSPDFLLEEDKSYLGKKPKRTYIGPRFNGGLSDHLPVIVLLKNNF